jgi:hypothetical protein
MMQTNTKLTEKLKSARESMVKATFGRIDQ